MKVDSAVVAVLFGVESHWTSAFASLTAWQVRLRFGYGETSPSLVEDG
jgi:hypothetical protein